MTASRRCLVNWFEFLLVLGGLCVVAMSGCSKPASEVIVSAEPPASPTADVAVRNVLAGLQRQELTTLWEFLPPSYRGDIEKLVHEIGERLDEKSWGPFVQTCRKARLVTSELVAESGKAANEADRGLIARLRNVEQLLNALSESELSDPGRLRHLDGARFLSGTGNRLIAAMSSGALGNAGLGQDAFSQFGEVKVNLSESTGDSAVLTVQWPGQEPTQHKFVRVEDHWIPQSLAEAWPTEFPKVREQCLAWVDELRSNPEPWHARLREVDGLLDELAATKSLAEARQVWQVGASHLAVQWFGAIPVKSPKSEEIPIRSPPPAKPARVKKPDTEVLLPDEPQK
jgi:hypothetical protein